MLLQVHDGKIRKIQIAGDFYDANLSYVFYLNGDSPQFVIFSEPRLYRLDSSGRVEELARREKPALIMTGPTVNGVVGVSPEGVFCGPTM